MKDEKKIGQLVNVTGDADPKKLGKVELIAFHWFGKKVGSMEFKGEKLRFKGDADTSAKLLFDRLKEFVEQYIQERLLSELHKRANKVEEITEREALKKQMEKLKELENHEAEHPSKG